MLSKSYNVVWIGREFPFKFSLLNFFYVLLSEFLELLVNYGKARFSTILVQFISLDALVALLFKRLFGTKTVLFAIGSDVLRSHEQIFAYPVVKHVISKSDVIFCVSPLIEDRLKQMGADLSKIKLISSLVDFDDFQKYNGPKEYDLITVGSLDINKNQMLLLDACKLLPHEIRGLVIGNGMMRENLEINARTYNLNVSFIGSVSHWEVFQKLQRAKVYVHTSRSEGLPVAVLEAFFVGLPVIVVESPYVSILKEYYGFQVNVAEPDSPEDLAKRITKVLNNYTVELQYSTLNKEVVSKMVSDLPDNVIEILNEIEQNVKNRS